MDINAIFREYERYVCLYVKRFKVKEIPLEDLEQEARIILWQSIEKYYTKKRNCTFKTYLTYKIRDIVPGVIARDWLGIQLPIRVYEKQRRIALARKILEEEGVVTTEAIEDITGLSRGEIEESYLNNFEFIVESEGE